MKPPLIHIGYAKCGSTWLQTLVFTSPDHFVDVGKGLLQSDVVAPEPLEFDPAVAREKARPKLELAERKGACAVASSERLAGFFTMGGSDRGIIAERLKAVFPEGKVLLIIREQVSMLMSSYRQFIREGGTLGLNRLLNGFRSENTTLPRFHWRHLEYDTLIRRYYELFGRDRVLVLPMEKLRRDRPAFLKTILDFAEVGPMDDERVSRPVHSGLSGPTAALKRRLNWVFAFWQNPRGLIDRPDAAMSFFWFFGELDRLVPRFVRRYADNRLRRQLTEMVEDRYAASNARTAALIDEDLKGLGYRITAELPCQQVEAAAMLSTEC